MISKNKKKRILTAAILSIAIIVANIFQAGTVSLVPLKASDFSQNNSDDVDSQYKNGFDYLQEDITRFSDDKISESQYDPSSLKILEDYKDDFILKREPPSFSDDKISESQYDPSSLKIREDDKVEFIVKKDSMEITLEMNQLFREYDVEIYEELPSINSIIVYISLDSIESFILDAESTPGIAYAEPNFYGQVCFVPDDEYYESEQWSLPLIGMETAWDYELGSHDVLVAVIDTGIDYNHPDLKDNYVPLGYDWVNNDSAPWDDNYHGTHCAGIIAASINNSIGIAGVANVSIFAEKVMGSSATGSHAHFKAGVMHAVDMGADILSISLGWSDDSSTLHEAIDYAIEKDVMVIVAAGNEGSRDILYPGRYPEVITVAATDQNDQKWFLSSYGPIIDVSAPGVDIYSTFPRNGYHKASGTSMATPHVAGLAALIMSRYPSLTSSQIEDLIKNNAVDLGDHGFDTYYGWGRIDTGVIFNIIESPIHIDENGGGDYTWQEAALQEWCIGDGTEENPYVIKNLKIDGGGSGSCILIENSEDYFRIENCEVYNSGYGDNDAGIKLISTTNGEIIDNECSLNYYGIYLTRSDNNTISGNNANDNLYSGIYLTRSDSNTISGNNAYINDYSGIYLNRSDSNTISGNNAYINDYSGIYLNRSDSNTISENTASNNDYGMYFSRSDSNTISGNIANNNDYGMYLFRSNSNTISENTANNNDHAGIILETSINNIMTNNNIFNNSYGILIEGSSSFNDFYLNSFYGSLQKHVFYVSYSGTGNSWDNGSCGNYWSDYRDKYPNAINNGYFWDIPYEIHGLVTEYDNFPLVHLYMSSIHIKDRTENNWEWARKQGWCLGEGTVENPYVIKDLKIDGGGSGSCILIENSHVYFRIENCILYNSGYYDYSAGIKLSYTRNGELIDNDVSQNVYGMYFFRSDSNTISGNTVNNNEKAGLNIFRGQYNTISGNIANNNRYGISLTRSDSNTISGNTFLNNLYSIYFNEYDGICSDNVFYFNLFYRCFEGHVNLGTGNVFFGNYWDDYNGVDANDDNIGDSPYSKNGVIDYYPIYRYRESPIYIDDSAENNWEWARKQIWCSGSGTDIDPYIIQDLIIDGSGSGSCILIENSNKNFRIENCKVYNSGTELLDAGIKLYNTTNGIIINNDCLLNTNGVYLEACSSNVISENIANNNSLIGILLFNCNNNIISGSTVINNSFGIYLWYSNDNNISENDVNDNDQGIYLEKCNSNVISGNTANNNDKDGIRLKSSNINTISNNIANNNARKGITLEKCRYNIISGNTANNNKDKDGIDLKYREDNKLSEDQANNDGEFGIYLLQSHDNIISNNTINNNFCGIYLHYSNDNTISGNFAFYNNMDELYLAIGIRLYHSSNNNISGNTAKYNTRGIYVGFNSNNNIASGNSAKDNNGAGLDIVYSYHNIFSGNNASNNEACGIRVKKGSYNTVSGNTAINNDFCGILITQTSSNTVSGNTAINNNICGINIQMSGSNTVSRNTANNNLGCGIFIQNGGDNTISENNASNNYGELFEGAPFLFYLCFLLNQHTSCGSGILLYYGNDNTISRNTVNNNYRKGIYSIASNGGSMSANTVNNNDVGISLKNSNSITISGNIISNSVQYGIYLDDFYGDNNNFTKNIITNTMSIGVRIAKTGQFMSENNLFYQNYFINNGLHAQNDAINTKWDNGSIGNYWDDYTGVDDDNNNIGDSPYSKNGVIDYYPIYRYRESPIYIDDSAENNWEWARKQIWCSGSGTDIDPYIIQDLIIDGSGSGSCILIENSRAYFRIENCKVYNSGTVLSDAGIKLYNTTNGIIINNDCLLNTNGIYLWKSYNNTVSGNIANDNSMIGILLFNCNNNIISGSTVINNSFGIYLWYSNDNNISENIANNNSFGIYLLYSNDNDISENTANNNEKEGIRLKSSNINTISNNTVNNNARKGIALEKCSFTVISGNTANNNKDKEGIDLKYRGDNTLSEDQANNDGEFGIYLLQSNDNTISNNTINNNFCGIYLHYSNDNIISGNFAFYNNMDELYLAIGIRLYHSSNNNISGNTAKYNTRGIYVGFNSNNNIASGNTANNNIVRGLDIVESIFNNFWGNNASNNGESGIRVKRSGLNTYSGNTANKNGVFGIIIELTQKNTVSGNTANDNNGCGILFISSNNNIISGNIVNNNYGELFEVASFPSLIFLFGSLNQHTSCGSGIILLWNSNDNTISRNTVNNNYRKGIYSIGSNGGRVAGNVVNNNDVGISLKNSNSITISGNIISNSVQYGIYLDDFFGDNNNFTKNIIINTMSIGVRIAKTGQFVSENNLFYQNYFINNGLHAQNDAINTKWDNGSIGNYWDDYKDKYPGATHNGNIWNTPYEIQGPVSGYDNYPLVRLYESPIYIDDNAENNWEWARTQYWCSGSGTEEDPYVIKDLIIDGGGSATGSCITIKNSNAYFRIENCMLYNSGFGGKDAGIRLINTNNGEIINNDISQNLYGIWLKNSNENILYYNILVENFIGIIIQDSSINIVIGNTFIDHQIGISIVGSSSNNPIIYNAFYGIRFVNVYYG